MKPVYPEVNTLLITCKVVSEITFENLNKENAISTTNVESVYRQTEKIERINRYFLVATDHWAYFLRDHAKIGSFLFVEGQLDLCQYVDRETNRIISKPTIRVRKIASMGKMEADDSKVNEAYNGAEIK